MGIYLNPDSSKFEEAVNSDIYVDKTGLLTYTIPFCIRCRNIIVSAVHDALENRQLPICSRRIIAGM